MSRKNVTILENSVDAIVSRMSRIDLGREPLTSSIHLERPAALNISANTGKRVMLRTKIESDIAELFDNFDEPSTLI